jgi:hypothetical protein
MPSRTGGQRSSGSSGPRHHASTPRSHNLPALQPRITSPAGASAASPIYSTPNAPRPSTRTGSLASTPGPPGAEKDGLPLEELGFERRVAIEEAAKILRSWDSLATLAMARGEVCLASHLRLLLFGGILSSTFNRAKMHAHEQLLTNVQTQSIPQARMYLSNVIIKANDPSIPLQPVSTKNSKAAMATDGYSSRDAYAPRRHDPPLENSETRDSAEIPHGSDDVLVDHKTARKDSRRREEARARYLGRGSEEPAERSGDSWQEVTGIAWEDLKDFSRFGTLVFPAREDPSEDHWAIKPITPSRRSRQTTPSSRESESKIPRRSLSPQPKRERERE